jgi:hypothetical protein
MAQKGTNPRAGVESIPAEPEDQEAGQELLLPLPPPGPLRVWLFAITSSLFAGLAGWYGAEEVSRSFRWEAHVVAQADPAQAVDNLVGLAGAARDQAEMKNGALTMGVLGGIYGLFLGAGGGWARPSKSSALTAGSIGLTLGAAAGALLPFLLFPVFYRSRTRPPDPMLPILIHTAIYASLCGVAGLAFGYGKADARGALQGFSAALMGGIVGTLFYSLLHTICFPLEWDFSTLPGTAFSRLLAFLSVVLIGAVCFASILAGKTEPKVSDEGPSARG